MMTLLLISLLATPAPEPPARTPDTVAACAVISRVVLDRLGPHARLTACTTDAADGRWTMAQPESTARTGRASWFVLSGPGQSARVLATVEVEATHVRAAHLLPRGRVLSPQDVQAADGPLVGARLARLLTMTEATGARSSRVIDPDAVVLAGDVVLPPVVRAGDPVTAVVRIGGVEVTAAMTAIDAGSVGDAIRIAHRDRKRVLQARVIGPGRVEVSYAQ